MNKVDTITNKNKINSLKKYYSISKILLILNPFMSFLYLSVQSVKMGSTIPQLLQQDPKFTILFLVSMINPFIAYLLIFVQNKINENDISYGIVNIVMFIIAEILLQNMLYIILFGTILYKTLKVYNISIKYSFKEKLKDKFLMSISGSLVVIGLACICLFATIRISI